MYKRLLISLFVCLVSVSTITQAHAMTLVEYVLAGSTVTVSAEGPVSLSDAPGCSESSVTLPFSSEKEAAEFMADMEANRPSRIQIDLLRDGESTGVMMEGALPGFTREGNEVHAVAVEWVVLT